MKKKEAKELVCGLYFISWKDGGGSVAAVGQDSKGRVWFHPTNWISGPSCKWKKVKTVELLTEQQRELEKRGMANCYDDACSH